MAKNKKKKRCKIESFKVWKESVNLKNIMHYADEDLPKQVVQRAYELFKMMEIPDDDFGIQASDWEYAVFGGTNRLIANRNFENENVWTFYLDEGLSNKNRVALWKNIPKKFKTLILDS